MHAHRIEIFDRADNDAIVGAVAHHLHLVFLPAQHGFFQQHLAGRRQIQTALQNLDQFLAVIGDAAAAAAEGEGRADDGRKADGRMLAQCLFHAVGDHRARRLQADFGHGAAEAVAVLGHVDGIRRGADHLYRVLLKHAMAHQIQRAVQRSLAAHGRQQRIGTFAGDDARYRAPVNRLDVHGIGHVRVGHDGGGIGVDQDDPVPLFPQGLARLRARVVELAGLADHDGTGADDQDAFQIGALGHGCTWRVTNRERGERANKRTAALAGTRPGCGAHPAGR